MPPAISGADLNNWVGGQGQRALWGTLARQADLREVVGSIKTFSVRFCIFKHGGSTMANFTRISVQDVTRHFEGLEDPRSEINRRHPLVSVVVIALMAVLAGAGGPSAIAAWANDKKDYLLNLLPLPNGIPQKDVYRRVLAALKPGAFEACFANWLQSLRAAAEAASGVEQPVFAVDGKTLRRSHDRRKGLGALHSVSIWATEFGLTLGQVATEEKSNEITAIPELLRLVDSSLPVGVKRFARAVRGHWGIENTCHWTLDVTYREDESRIRDVNVRQNFA